MQRFVSISVALFAALACCAGAQRSGGHFGGHFTPGFAQHFGASPGAYARGVYPGAFGYGWLPFGGYPDGLYSDALYNAGYPLASQPPIILMQQAQATDSPARVPPYSQPLLIELQGDRYVQISGPHEAGNQITEEPDTRQPSNTSAPPAAESAVLVFRDGHREEVSGYTITGGVLYASANYYIDGKWNEKIPLSQLNLPETVAANRSRGISFQLPTASNEVIVGP